jgi:predicted PurR-regulated permease PerM
MKYVAPVVGLGFALVAGFAAWNVYQYVGDTAAAALVVASILGLILPSLIVRSSTKKPVGLSKRTIRFGYGFVTVCYVFFLMMGVAIYEAANDAHDRINQSVNDILGVADAMMSDTTKLMQKHQPITLSKLTVGDPEEKSLAATFDRSHEGHITVTFNYPPQPGVHGATIIFVPSIDTKSGAINWDCTKGTLVDRFRPRLCQMSKPTQEETP